MGDPLPHLGGLSVNGPAVPTATDRPALPPDISEIILAQYLAKLKLEELCEANLLLICMGLRGTNQCNDPDDPLWKAACARFGLTERLVGGTPGAPATPTWHVTFLAMCKEVATLNPDELEAYKGLLRGDDAYEDGPFSDDSDDDDADEEAPPQRRLRLEVRQLWNRAAERGLFCMVHYLLRRVDGIVHHGDDRALVTASTYGRAAVVEVLLAHGADVHIFDDTALRNASHFGHAAVVEVLLAHGADVHIFDDAALRMASMRGRLAVVEVLLAHGADVHANGDQALREARSAAIKEVLLAAGATEE